MSNIARPMAILITATLEMIREKEREEPFPNFLETK